MHKLAGKTMRKDYAARAERLRDRANECRALADVVGEERARASYLRLAEAYEVLADEEDHPVHVHPGVRIPPAAVVTPPATTQTAVDYEW